MIGSTVVSGNISNAKRWLPQGLRFGIVIALLAPVPMCTSYYVVQPMPASLVVQQVLADGLLVILLGVIVAFLDNSTTAG